MGFVTSVNASGAGLDMVRSSIMRKFLLDKIEAGYFSSGHILAAQNGRILVDECAGASPETRYNIESITKVMVTLPIAFKLIEQGRLRLDDAVAEYIPQFAAGHPAESHRDAVTIRQLLNFTGGIPLEDPPGAAEAAAAGDLSGAWAAHYRQEPAFAPGSRVLYSDVSCRILGKVLETVAEMDLDTAARRWFFDPLGMNHTTFLPPDPAACANTGRSDSGRSLQGQLTQDLEHDMGEVLGSDGLFSTAADMLTFAQMLLDGGTKPAGQTDTPSRLFSEAAVERMTGSCTNAQIAEEPVSGLHYLLSGPKIWFWELAAAPFSYFGDLVSDAAIGKLGGAGTFLLIDPVYELVIVYLTNYGQPAATLTGEDAWTRFHRDLDMPAICNRIISGL